MEVALWGFAAREDHELFEACDRCCWRSWRLRRAGLRPEPCAPKAPPCATASEPGPDTPPTTGARTCPLQGDSSAPRPQHPHHPMGPWWNYCKCTLSEIRWNSSFAAGGPPSKRVCSTTMSPLARIAPLRSAPTVPPGSHGVLLPCPGHAARAEQGVARACSTGSSVPAGSAHAAMLSVTLTSTAFGVPAQAPCAGRCGSISGAGRRAVGRRNWRVRLGARR